MKSQLITNQRVVGFCFALLSCAYIWASGLIPLDFWSESEPFNARSMPYLFGYASLGVSLLLILLPTRSFDWAALRVLNYLPALYLLILLTTYSVLLEYLGFLGSTTLLLASGFWLLGERRVVAIVLVSLGLTLGFYGCMSLLGIYLSPGEWWLQRD